MNEDSAPNPYQSPQSTNAGVDGGPDTYESVPIWRRNGFCSGVMFIHVLALIAGGCSPLALLPGAFTTIAVAVVCLVVLTGPIYCKKTAPDGTLDTWTIANKAAPLILLIVSAGVYGALIYWIFSLVAQ